MTTLPPLAPRPTAPCPPPRPLDELRAEAAARLAASPPVLPAAALLAAWSEADDCDDGAAA